MDDELRHRHRSSDARRWRYFGLESGLRLGIRRTVRADLRRLVAALHRRRDRVGAAGVRQHCAFPTSTEFAVFSSPLPVVAAGDVVQAVSGFAPDVPVGWAAAAVTLNCPATVAAATRVILIS